ncbi:hypothetical protein H257_04387 [Aphanomyces astaci]|uniref:Uncharacterized protein n=1 Tax=Aphanomyces astaci TaxID=112090 RepID=W4GWP6_APHAT|nr:hypothetical protein H257_04387 [Aphanomyces astaci]ETV83756.1 hypothetical protein H257_04387 [Aphanomyces astaci]RQM30885.1 hypothetical protein B5M09_011192 [Aphanomyces astaci]|eukprot:XP_009827186.1 hypothetical protein H257_04387 [Aphanomyces astaci]
MKAVYFAACVAALVNGQATKTTLTPTSTPPIIKALCTSVEISEINALESTPSYNTCRSDAQKQIFDGQPNDICAVPSCVTAVKNLVGKYPRCVFDTRVPANDVLPYAKQCNVDPLVTTPPETTTPKPQFTVAPTPNTTTVEDEVTTTATPSKTTSKVATTTATPVVTSAASTLSVALTASVALVYSMF